MLPMRTRIVKIIEMKAEEEARKVIVFRRRVSEVSATVDVGGHRRWNIIA